MDPTYKAPGIASGLDKIGEFREAVFIDGEIDLNARKVVVKTTVDMKAGSVMGLVERGAAAITATATGGNTGNGTVGTITAGPGVKVGTYVLRITTASTNGGQFQLIRPDGLAAGTGNVGVAFSGGGLSFTLADGATDFAVNDSFSIVVPPGTGQMVLSTSAATDGSSVPTAILAHDIVVVDGEDEYESVVYESGRFLADQLTYGAGHTAQTVRAVLRDVNITLRM